LDRVVGPREDRGKTLRPCPKTVKERMRESVTSAAAVVIDEVESQSVINVYRREWSRTRFRPAHTKQVRETLGRNALISR
jgi:hypothetical protein